MGRITEDGRRKNAKCMNWHENVECRKWRMKIRRYNRAFYQKKMHLENGTNSSLQNTFVISTWFYFLRKTAKKNGKKKKAFKCPGCLIEWLGHYVKKMPCLCKLFEETSKGFILRMDSILTVIMEEKKLIILKELILKGEAVPNF